MAKFIIEQRDPAPYRGEIIKFWKEYLPGTPAERLDWMSKGNPAGPARWFLAFEEVSGELAGTLSVMPKKMSVNGKPLMSGIMGDLMVSKKYRVFGPGPLLPKTLVKSQADLGLDLIYTVPNEDSIKICEHSGFRNVAKVLNLVKPLSLRYYIEKYMPSMLCRLFPTFLELVLKSLSRETYFSVDGIIEEEHRVDSSFDALWEKVRHNNTLLIGDRSPQFLEWKYFQNPQYCFRLLTYRHKSDGSLLGYVFFSSGENKLGIFDILVVKRRYLYGLLKKVVSIARLEGCHAIYIGITDMNPLIPLLKRCFFLNAGGDYNVMAIYNGKWSPHGWGLMSGDRNI